MASETKDYSVKFEIKQDGDNGTFEGYASVFGEVDSHQDIVMPGAFANSLKDRKVKLLWQHNMDQPIGVVQEIREDHKGLYIKGLLLGAVEKGREALELIRAGAIDAMSIGYRTVKSSFDGDGTVRSLIEVDLFEVSLVSFPSLESALVMNVKSIKTIRDFEATLRDAGFSLKESKAIAAEGFKGLKGHRDGVTDVVKQDGINSIHESITKLKEKFNAKGY